MSTLSSEERYSPGDRVIYRRRGENEFTDLPAIFVRSQITSGREMYVVQIDGNPKPRQVGVKSVRRA